MQNFLTKRFIPFLLAISITCSLCVAPVSAANSSGDKIGSVANFLGIYATIADMLGSLGRHWNHTNPEDYGEWYITTQLASAKIRDGNYVNYEKSTLSDLALSWNTEFSVHETPYDWRARAEVRALDVGRDGDPEYIDVVMLIPVYSGNIFDNPHPVCLTHVDGSLICHFQDSDGGWETPLRWLPRSRWATSLKHMAIKEDLANLARDNNGYLITIGDFYAISRSDGQLLATPEGHIYAGYVDENKTATNQDRPTTSVKDEDGNNVDVSGAVNLDALNGLLTLFGDVYNIDQLLYDEGTKTYYVDASTTVNVTNNYYFKWEYHINHTSITYIGQTEEYDKYYEVYYELPDGRDSADLTKEELEQLNLAMDVIPYGRGTDNTNLRSLYHFDGDTRDASYWNYCTNFDWKYGASLTYMDAGVFNGALYLDENLHNFEVTLPSPIYTDNFTVQFRYYQSATPAPVTDSSIRFEGTEGGILRWDGNAMYDINGDRICTLPAGTWNEIAITRYRYATRYYLNGVCVREITDRSSFGDEIEFTFGSQQQTYKYLDELRILNHALKDDGSDYTPTSVPHDTNLSLVLPTDAVPLADEYWDFNDEGNLFRMSDFTSFFDTETFVTDTDSLGQYRLTSFTTGESINMRWIARGTLGEFVTVTPQQGCVSVCNITSSQKIPADVLPAEGGITFSLARRIPTGTPAIGTSHILDYEIVWGGDYVFTVMLADGSLYSIPFQMPAKKDTSRVVLGSVVLPNGTYLGVHNYQNTGTHATYIVILPPANGQVDIAYMELVEGSEPNTGHEFVESVTVIDKDDINKATLAVRTDIPITKHYIGGVRPSVPQKGYVWALVENQRIKSLQIYNGQAWEAVDGRIWTGERWVPYSSYNIITMQDLFDVQDATQDFEYIYTEQGFWDWWQKSWNEFTAKLFNALGGGAGSDPSKLPTDGTEAPEDSGKGFMHFVVVLRDGFWSVCVGLANAVYGGFEGLAESVSTAGDFFTSYGSGDESIWLLPIEEGVSVWD